MNQGNQQHLTLPLELVPGVLHHAHGCLYPGDCCVCGFPGTKSSKYVWPEIPGPGKYSGRGLLDSMGLGSEKGKGAHGFGSP